MKGAFFILLALLTTGCSTYSYHNAPNKVAYECRKDSTSHNYSASVNSYSGQASSSQKLNYRMMQSCIKARGYRIEEVTCWFGSCPDRSI